MSRGGIGNIMKQAQQMQRRMAELQEELGKKQVEASAGGGMVTAVVSGKQQLLNLKIDPAAVDPEDVDHADDIWRQRSPARVRNHRFVCRRATF